MPVSLLQNWTKELKKWCPGVDVIMYHNVTLKQRTEYLNDFTKHGGILLTSYGMFTSQIDNLEKLCRKVDYMFLDEGHKIKNPSTKLAGNIRKIKCEHRVVLTGTPVMNDLMEMFSILDYIFKGELLGTAKTFSVQFAKKIERGNQKDASYAEKKLGVETSNKFQQIIAPYFLRREKSKVLGVEQGMSVQKNDLVVWLYLEKPQLDLYKQFISSSDVKDVLNKTSSALAALTVLKQICDHPMLLKKDSLDLDSQSVSSIVSASGKLKFMVELLKDLSMNGHRCLIFSQSTKMLDIIGYVLKKHKMTFLRIDGTISDSRKRQQVIDQYNDDDSWFCFLLTTQVGGVGLTLNSADRVIVFDPSWNPATDNQAVDRAYRIGQKKNVVVYRLMTCSGIEEKIYRKQIFKDSLSRSATEKSNQYRYFSKDELSALFRLDDPAKSETQIQLSQLHEKERNVYPELKKHIDDLKRKDRFPSVFGLSDHDRLFKTDDVESFEDEGLKDVEKSFGDLSLIEPPTMEPKIPNDQREIYSAIRKYGENAWMKIALELGISSSLARTKWENVKANTPHEQILTFLNDLPSDLPQPKISRSMNSWSPPQGSENTGKTTIVSHPHVELSGQGISEGNKKKVDFKEDDDILHENLLHTIPKSKIIVQTNEVIELSSNENTPEKPKNPTPILINKENQVPDKSDDVIEVSESESDDEDRIEQPEEILAHMENDENPETPEQISKRLSMCFGLLTQEKPRKRLLVLSDDEDDTPEDPMSKYYQLLDQAIKKEELGDLTTSLGFYMDAFDISKKDDKLAFKIKQLVIELGLE